MAFKAVGQQKGVPNTKLGLRLGYIRSSIMEQGSSKKHYQFIGGVICGVSLFRETKINRLSFDSGLFFEQKGYSFEAWDEMTYLNYAVFQLLANYRINLSSIHTGVYYGHLLHSESSTHFPVIPPNAFYKHDFGLILGGSVKLHSILYIDIDYHMGLAPIYHFPIFSPGGSYRGNGIFVKSRSVSLGLRTILGFPKDRK